MPLALIVEDDAQSREMFSHVLRSISFDVDEATTGTQALSYLEGSTPNLVVLDIRLPQVKGDTILEYIYAQPRLRHTRVIITTAYGTLPPELVLREGDVFFTKPLSIKALRDAALDIVVRG